MRKESAQEGGKPGVQCGAWLRGEESFVLEGAWQGCQSCEEWGEQLQ